MIESDVAIVVGACDKYRACFGPFCHGMSKYWPEPRWPLKFVTNFVTPPCGDSIKVGDDGGDWSYAMRAAMAMIQEPIILWFIEDFWLTALTDTKAVGEFADLIRQDKVDHIQLMPTWKPRRDKGTCPFDDRLLVFAVNPPGMFSNYRASLQVGLWRKSVFEDLIRIGETCWEFEVKGTRRSEVYGDRFVGVKKCLYVHHATPNDDPAYERLPVSKGKWTSAAQLYAEREGLAIDLSCDPKDVSI